MNNKKVTVFIDCENISSEYIPQIFENLKKFASISFAKAYGNWKILGKNWEKMILKYGIEEEHVISTIKGKNSVDIKMTIDILNMSNKNNVDSVVIISSDSDFRSLVLDLKSKNIETIGFGEVKTHESLKNVYNTFIELPINLNIKKNDKLLIILKDAIKNVKSFRGVTLISQIGSYLKEKDPYYRPKNFDVKSWTEAFKKYEEIFQIGYLDKRKSIMYVKELK
ncbi:NYN domain-containing protein [Arcobacter sp. YIC-310]|uniref:NYN domain-containing protein n=1 Tax=Arcobacter sp. YIC-310 TaxID=3376632 RepID=UPI003C15E7D0